MKNFDLENYLKLPEITKEFLRSNSTSGRLPEEGIGELVKYGAIDIKKREKHLLYP